MFGAIEFNYNGIKFRSKLEARWAVYFDTIGVEYIYEYECYQLKSGKYVPDFYFPKYDFFGEVKPDWSKVEHIKYLDLCDLTGKKLIPFVGLPSAKVTLSFPDAFQDNNNHYMVIPFVDIAKSSYGHFWMSGYDLQSEDDSFNDSSPFKEAVYNSRRLNRYEFLKEYKK